MGRSGRNQDAGRPVWQFLVLALVALLAGLALLVSGSGAGVSCLGKAPTIVRGGGNDLIRGTEGPDVIYAGAGNDRVIGAGGGDKICGGPGNDRLGGGRGNDRINGGGGTDQIRGGHGNDRLNGGPGDRDYVDGGPGDDREVAGGPGDRDVLVGNTGADRIDGGPGQHDVASYATATTRITADLGRGTVSGDVFEHLRGIEDVLGGAAGDRITGSARRNRLDGGPGNDRLRSVGSGDVAYGGPGSDLCVGGFASRNSCGPEHGGGNAVGVELDRSIDGDIDLVLTGTSRSDAITVQGSGRSIIATGHAGTLVSPGGRGTGCRSISKSSVRCRGRVKKVLATMGSGNDFLSLRGFSHRTSATLDGGPGADRISSSDGSDVLYGGEDGDPDRLSGGGGNDVLFGINPSHPRKNSGAARMFGGSGNDLLIGGQPCDGDLFNGGRGPNDSASFARVKNSGIVVSARIGGVVTDPGAGGNCRHGRIDDSVERIEGSSGPDRIYGDGSANTLIGRGGDDFLDGNGGHDSCSGGGGRDRAASCEERHSIP